MRTRWGNTLVIANPVAHAGAAREVAGWLMRSLGERRADDGPFDLMFTERPGHAAELAARAAGYATVLAVGGDGVVHEVANGLMRHEPSARPVLGVVPVGSGNDYARTLGLREVRQPADLAQLDACAPAALDVGRVTVPGEAGAAPAVSYFIETCSFGLDAEIALGTMDLRRQTPLKGAALYLASGLNVFGLRYRDFPVDVSFDGAPGERMRSIIFAVQLGPTYGSGFRVTPEADPTDGLFDVCYAAGPVPRAVALPVFLSARAGHHVRSKHIELRRARRLAVRFDAPDVPIQVDGERLRARALELEVVPAALSVLRPHASDRP